MAGTGGNVRLTLFLLPFVSFFFGFALVVCCGVGGAALLVCGDAV